MPIDRSSPPPLGAISQVHLPLLNLSSADNGLRLYTLTASHLEGFSLKVVFKTGILAERKALVASFLARWLGEGQPEILQSFEQLGVSFKASATPDTLEFDISGRSAVFNPALTTLDRAIFAPQFDPAELKLIQSLSIESYKVSLRKTSFRAMTAFREAVYGASHPLGQSADPERVSALSAEDLMAFYQEFISGCAFDVVLVGGISQTEAEAVFRLWGQRPLVQPPTVVFPPATGSATRLHLPMEHAVQASVVSGMLVCCRNSPDHPSFRLLNEVLGGYSGSRLMQVLREKQGFTYGAYSSVSFTKESGLFYIAADVALQGLEKTWTIIGEQMNLLQQELIGQDELSRVKSHMLGAFLRKHSDLFLVALLQYFAIFDELGQGFWERLITAIMEVSPEELRATAQKYFSLPRIEVACGG